MLKYSLWLLFISAGVHANDRDATSRIIKGKPAQDGSTPYMASVQVTGQGHKCGGTILDTKWILTAAHCVQGLKTDNLRVVVGTNNVKDGGQKFNVKKATVHPDYKKLKLTNDIALLELSKSMEFGDKVQAIPLTDKDTETGANVMVTGWGLTVTGQSAFPDKLKTLNQTAFSAEDCKEIIGDFETEKKLCTVQQRKGTGLCVGDGGSPLVEGNDLVGIASFILYECGSKFPNGYTRVLAYKDWIKKNMS